MPTGRRLVRRTPRTHRGNVYLAPLDSRRAESAARERRALVRLDALAAGARPRARALATSHAELLFLRPFFSFVFSRYSGTLTFISDFNDWCGRVACPHSSRPRRAPAPKEREPARGCRLIRCDTARRSRRRCEQQFYILEILHVGIYRSRLYAAALTRAINQIKVAESVPRIQRVAFSAKSRVDNREFY